MSRSVPPWQSFCHWQEPGAVIDYLSSTGTRMTLPSMRTCCALMVSRSDGCSPVVRASYGDVARREALAF